MEVQETERATSLSFSLSLSLWGRGGSWVGHLMGHPPSTVD
ncbi:unnamed protein product [Spirodela intermedia]|uniref:Uncharacterized protein n=1 Tax=Spirodela intermedia TaxID=51605 RepID=A0A7I8J2M5_SPIIN|nr:unnamed protein product [Spirodela intermedia]CAA6663580.1 unnamed protein product [Spirodela intermedia]